MNEPQVWAAPASVTLGDMRQVPGRPQVRPGVPGARLVGQDRQGVTVRDWDQPKAARLIVFAMVESFHAGYCVPAYRSASKGSDV